MIAPRGRERSVAPVLQSTVPDAGAETLVSTQRPTGGLRGFGTASGGPKKHPVVVQLPLLPVSGDAVEPTVATGPVHPVSVVTNAPASGRGTGGGVKVLPPPL